jgi:hypothetical protein
VKRNVLELSLQQCKPERMLARIVAIMTKDIMVTMTLLPLISLLQLNSFGSSGDVKACDVTTGMQLEPQYSVNIKGSLFCEHSGLKNHCGHLGIRLRKQWKLSEV